MISRTAKQLLTWSAFSLAITLVSCEKTIDLELEESEPQIVIEAILREGNHPFEVTVSKSTGFFDNSPQTTLSDATVSLQDEQGNTIDIPHESNGLYRTTIEATALQTYKLTVMVEGQQFTAQSFMPEKIAIEELDFEYQEQTSFEDAGYEIFFRFNDPAGVDNYYRAVHFLNNVEQKEAGDLLVVDDNLFDGGFAKFPLTEQIFNPQETVAVELIHFDKKSYDYFNAFIDITNTAGGLISSLAAPGNPTTNWSGNALGYFTAQSSDTLEIVLPNR